MQGKLAGKQRNRWPRSSWSRWWWAPPLILGIVLPLVGGVHWWGSGDRRGPAVTRQVTARIARQMVSPDLIFARGQGGRVNLLVMGVDVNRDRRGQVTPELGRTDTIVVFTLDRAFRTVQGLSIPRDVRMEIPEHGRQKVNAAHAFGGPYLLVETLSRNLCIPIHHYIRTSFSGLISIVDELGGVKLYVEKDMDYDDNWGQLHIHLKQGWQVLDGEKAHQYSRFRRDRQGDLGRIRRQQKLMRAIARKVLSPAMIFKLPALMGKIRENISTDLTSRELLSLAVFLQEVDGDQIELVTLPVYDDGPDLLPRWEAAEKILRTCFGSLFDHYAWKYQKASEEKAPVSAGGSRLLPPPDSLPLRELEEPEEVDGEDFGNLSGKTEDSSVPDPSVRETDSGEDEGRPEGEGKAPLTPSHRLPGEVVLAGPPPPELRRDRGTNPAGEVSEESLERPPPEPEEDSWREISPSPATFPAEDGSVLPPKLEGEPESREEGGEVAGLALHTGQGDTLDEVTLGEEEDHDNGNNNQGGGSHE